MERAYLILVMLCTSTLLFAHNSNTLYFDGTGDFLNCGNTTSLHLSSGTIEARIKTPDAGPAHRGIVAKPGACGLYLQDSELVACDWLIGDDISTGILLNDNIWHHVSMPPESGESVEAKTYVNGNSKAIGLFPIWDQTTERALTYDRGNDNQGNHQYYTLSEATSNGVSEAYPEDGVEDENALHFVGSDVTRSQSDQVQVPSLSNLVLIDHDFTLEAWVKLSETANNHTILSKGNGHWINSHLIFEIVDQKVSLSLGGSGWKHSQPNVPYGEWVHVAVSFNYAGKTAKFYINGVFDSQAIYSTVTPEKETDPLYIGRQGSACNCNFFNGAMDNLNIWEVERSADEIYNTYGCQPITGTESGLVAAYNFNQGAACGNNALTTTLTDISGNGHHGNLVNFDLTDGSCTSNWVDGKAVFDIVAPVPDVSDLPGLTGKYSVQVSSTPTAIDDCDGPITATTTDPVTYTEQGTYLVTWTYTDGNGNAMTQIQNVIVDDGEEDNNALHFVGSDETALQSDQVEVPSLSDLVLIDHDFTLEAWVNLSETASNHAILSKGNGNSEYSHLIFEIVDQKVSLSLGGGGWHYSEPNVPYGEWAHVAVSFNHASKTAKFYINGVFDSQATYSSVIPEKETNPLYIGRQGYKCNCNFFNGAMDNLNIWEVERSADEIYNTYGCQPITGTESGLVAAYNFNQGAACDNNALTTTLTDISGNGHHGNLVNFDLTDGSCTSNWVDGKEVFDIVGPVPDVPDLPNLTGECSVQISVIPTAIDDCDGPITATTTDPLTYSEPGSYLVTWTFSDSHGNTSTQLQNVGVADHTDPAISCPDDFEVLNDDQSCGAIVDYEITISDNCELGELIQTSGLASGSAFPVGTTVNIFVVTDAAGNQSSCSFQVTVRDTEVPTIVCPEDINVVNDDGSCGAVVSYDLEFGDNCEGATIEQIKGLASGSAFPVGTTVNIFVVTDAAGNQSSCSFQVTVRDTEVPTIVCPEDINVVNDDGSCGAVVSYDLEFGDNCEGATIEQIKGLASGSAFPVGTTVNIFVVTDAAGNQSSCSFQVTVRDTEVPTIVCPEDINVVNDDGSCGAVVSYDLEFGDNCEGATIEQTEGLTSGSAFPVGTTVNIFVVTDAAGNQSSCSFQVTVKDMEVPTIVCPEDIVVANDNGSCGAVVSYDLEFGDNCEGATIEQIKGLASGSAFPVGTTVNIFVVTDAAGNQSSCSFQVTVRDTEVPTVVCPEDIVVANDNGSCGAVVSYDLEFGDNCEGATIEQIKGLTSGSAFPVGTTVNIFVVTDAAGNQSSCSFQVTVRDVEKPTISCPSSISISADELSCEVAGVVLETPLTNDNCQVISVKNNAPVLFPLGNTTVIWTVTDAAGNTASCTQAVFVKDITPPTFLNCPAAIEYCGEQAVQWIAPDASDNCGVKLSQTHSPGEVFPVGTTTVTYTATDEAGNTAVCSFDVTIHPLPKVSISRTTTPAFCQGLAELHAIVTNASALTPPLTYLWSEALEEEASMIAFENGLFEVSVTDAHQCQTTAAYTLNVIASDVLSGYTLISKKDTELKQSMVHGGGVGVMDDNKKAKIKDDSHVYGFVKAPEIDLDQDCSLASEIEAPANISLPPFYENNHTGGEKIEVEKNGSLTLKGQIYGELKIKQGGKLIIDSPEIYFEKIKVEDGASMEFVQSARVMVDGDIKLDKNVAVLSGEYSVTFYTEKKFEVDEGGLVEASVFAQKDIHAQKATEDNQTELYGLFIAMDKIQSKEYVNWHQSTTCNIAPAVDSDLREVSEESKFYQTGTLEQNTSLNHTKEELEMEIFPNPAFEAFSIQTLGMSEAGQIQIFDQLGRLVYKREVEAGSKLELSARPFTDGVYMVTLISKNESRTRRLVIAK